MTELHAGLETFRHELRDAIARDLERGSWPRIPRWRAVRFGAVLAGAGAGWRSRSRCRQGRPSRAPTPRSSRHVRAALTAPAGAILHERALVSTGSSTSTYELWIETEPPHNYHVIKWGHDATGTDGSSYDLAATLRSLVDAGKATVESATTLGGTPAYKLRVSGAARPSLDGTVYVARFDYHPLLIDSAAYGASGSPSRRTSTCRRRSRMCGSSAPERMSPGTDSEASYDAVSGPCVPAPADAQAGW
jgi:hypothetical protein